MDEPDPTPLQLPCATPTGPLYGRLSIAHLLLITAGSAVAIWLMQPPNGKAATLEVVISIMFAPVYGTALAVIVLAFWRMRTQWGVAIADEPGHWLLIIIGGGFAGPALLIRSASWISQSPGAGPQTREALLAFLGICVGGALLLAAVAALLVVLVEYRDSRRWQAVFCLLGLTVVAPRVLVVLLLASATYAAAIDIRQRQYRDLWHWLGVAALFAAVCHAVLFIFVLLPRR